MDIDKHFTQKTFYFVYYSLQDDYRVCMEFNIIQRDQAPVCPVDASGCFTSEVIDFAGQYVKVSDTSDIYM